MKAVPLLLLVPLMICCASLSESKKLNNTLDLQGHRGCRGLLPENTIPAFLKALEIGVTTLEMDLVISKDKQVVVSHEPFFAHEISTDPKGNPITEADAHSHNMYEMTYQEIAAYDVGLRQHERFPKQQVMKAVKPLFSDVVKAAEQKTKAKGYNPPFYNVEIKRQPKHDGKFHPEGLEFAKLVVQAVQQTGIKDRIMIQSFDPESLQFVKTLDPEIQLVLLIQNRISAKENIEALGFKPEVYSPYFKLIDQELANYCTSENIKLIPWTVNEEEDMKAMIQLNVDGIITDYPDVLKRLLTEDGMQLNLGSAIPMQPILKINK